MTLLLHGKVSKNLPMVSRGCDYFFVLSNHDSRESEIRSNSIYDIIEMLESQHSPSRQSNDFFAFLTSFRILMSTANKFSPCMVRVFVILKLTSR